VKVHFPLQDKDNLHCNFVLHRGVVDEDGSTSGTGKVSEFLPDWCLEVQAQHLLLGMKVSGRIHHSSADLEAGARFFICSSHVRRPISHRTLLYFMYPKLQFPCNDMSTIASLIQLHIALLLTPPAHDVHCAYCKLRNGRLCTH
jgi:hypothetical protein